MIPLLLSGVELSMQQVGQLGREYQLIRLLPAFAFGVVLLVAVRIFRRPLVIPLKFTAPRP